MLVSVKEVRAESGRLEKIDEEPVVVEVKEVFAEVLAARKERDPLVKEREDCCRLTEILY